MQGKIYLVTGGTRSGKSYHAETLAAGFSLPVTYIATAVITDEEMQERVNLHQMRRPDAWETREEHYEISALINEIGSNNRVLLLDCLTVFVGNLLWKNSGLGNEELREIVLTEIQAIIEAAKETGTTLIVVTSEVGLGLVPDDSISRFYRDLLGEVNQSVAKASEEVYFVAAGIPLALKHLSGIL